MKSMTAYASVSFNLKSKRFRLEIQSLNKKGLEIQTDLPQSFLSLNIPIRLFLSQKIERGALLIRLKEESSDKQLFCVPDLLSLKQSLESLALGLGYSKDVISFQMLVDKSQVASNFDIQISDIEAALEECTIQLIKMRHDEGQRLLKDLIQRFDLIHKIVLQIETLQENVPLKTKDSLLERIKTLQIQGHDEDRLSKEVIYYVEKQDVTEEITRLKSHLEQMNILCKSQESIGRKLEFLTQECFRELNTLCAKTSELQSINLTLVLKTEFEKIKEQIMNIE